MTAFQRLMEIVEQSGVCHVIHQHEATRTVDDMARTPLFEIARIVKTVAFRTRDGGIILAALRGTRRVDYPRLAALVGVNRRDLAPLSPEEVRLLTGCEPGAVSPLPFTENAMLFIDEDVLTIAPTLFCGTGSVERTLEIAPGGLARLARCRTGKFSK